VEARRKRLRTRLVAELLSLQEARLRAVLKEALVVASSVGLFKFFWGFVKGL
jgi:hypothetical protein